MDVTFESPSNLSGTLRAPPSKSYTHRAYLTSLACGGGIVRNPLNSDDTDGTREALKSFSAGVQTGPDRVKIKVEQPLRVVDERIDARESGTLLRFLLPLVSLLEGPESVTLIGRETLAQRSNREPLESLRSAGVRVSGTGSDGTVPIECSPGQTVEKKRVPVACSTTSQLLSGWLITLAAVGGGSLRQTTELVSAPYVTMTEQVLSAAGVSVDHPWEGEYRVEPESSGSGFEYDVPGDFSSAAFLLVGAALSEGTVVLRGLNPEDPQADRRIIDLLKELGASIQWRASGSADSPELVVEGPFRPGEFRLDAGDCPDLVPVLSVLGAVAEGKAVIENVAHLKNKESDRLGCTSQELRKAGYEVTTTEDSLTVGKRVGDPDSPVVLDAHEDHRLAMSFSVLGMILGDVTVTGAQCVSKSYPGFYEDLEALGVPLTRVE